MNTAKSIPQDSGAYYECLTSRNHHFVEPGAQEGLRRLKVLIAGCGSTGGACIEALARAGVCEFWLADNDVFELSNMNRQHVRLDGVGKNKARFHAEEVLAINPFAKVTVSDTGINMKNVDEFVRAVDLVFDAIDVTTEAGFKAKILLHQKCHELKKPTLAGLDLGFVQWGHAFDYRSSDIAVMDGKATKVAAARNPMAALFTLHPVGIIPGHCVPLILDLFNKNVPYASQVGCTSDALSALIVPIALRYVTSGELVKGWKIDTSTYRYTRKELWYWRIMGFILRWRLRRLLKQTF